jgi:hypothetical protein
MTLGLDAFIEFVAGIVGTAGALRRRPIEVLRAVKEVRRGPLISPHFR